MVAWILEHTALVAFNAVILAMGVFATLILISALVGTFSASFSLPSVGVFLGWDWVNGQLQGLVADNSILSFILWLIGFDELCKALISVLGIYISFRLFRWQTTTYLYFAKSVVSAYIFIMAKVLMPIKIFYRSIAGRIS